MSEQALWGLLIVNVAWLALNTWHTAMNNRQADDNLRQARETSALIEKARRIARVPEVVHGGRPMTLRECMEAEDSQ